MKALFLLNYPYAILKYYWFIMCNKEKMMIEFHITGTVYSVYHWADVPESEDTYWSGLSSGKEYWKHPLPHASQSEVRASCCVGKWGFGLVGFSLVDCGCFVGIILLCGFFFSVLFMEQCSFTYLYSEMFCITRKQAFLMWIFLCLGENFRMVVNTFFSISKKKLKFWWSCH